MKRPSNCSLCCKEPKLADRCTQAARDGWNDSRIAIELLGSRGRRSALQTHLDHIPGLHRTPEANNGRPEGPLPATLTAKDLTPIVPRTHEEIKEHWGLALAAARDALLEQMNSGERVGLDKSIKTFVEVVNCFAKAERVPGFVEGAAVTIDNRTQVYNAIVDRMSEEDLRAVARGEKLLPALPPLSGNHAA